MTIYYRTNDGKFLGGFDGSTPAVGAIQVPFPPKDARFLWDGAQWIEPAALADVIIDEKRKEAVVEQSVTVEDKVNALWMKANADDAEFNRIDAIIKKAEVDFPKK